MSTPSSIYEYIATNEGWRSKPYCDKCGATLRKNPGGWFCNCDEDTGVLTVGHGTNLEQGITSVEGDFLLKCRVDAMVEELKLRSWFIGLQVRGGVVRTYAMIDLCYQVGTAGVDKFVTTISHIEASEWDAAADSLANSLVGKQTPARNARRVYMMRKNEWPPD